MECRMASVHPDIYDVCPRRFSVCKGREFSAGTVVFRQKHDLLAAVYSRGDSLMARMCACHQHSTGTVQIFYGLHYKNRPQNRCRKKSLRPPGSLTGLNHCVNDRTGTLRLSSTAYPCHQTVQASAEQAKGVFHIFFAKHGIVKGIKRHTRH